tara:strand:- start:638 stop:778 length:141 start_codon:yes stop_codon:yes gene_type:complete
MEQIIKKLEKQIEEGDVEGANNKLDNLIKLLEAISEPVLPEIVKEG